MVKLEYWQNEIFKLNQDSMIHGYHMEITFNETKIDDAAGGFYKSTSITNEIRTLHLQKCIAEKGDL